jgi:hypothetical protein
MINYMKLLQQTHNIWMNGDHENIKFIRYVLDELQNLWCIYIDDTRYVDAAFEDAFHILCFEGTEKECFREMIKRNLSLVQDTKTKLFVSEKVFANFGNFYTDI